MGFLFSGLATAPLKDVVAAAQADPRDDSVAMNEVVRRFDGLAVRVAGLANDSPEDRDELANTARVALVRAVRNHDGRPGFPSYARIYMQRAVERAHRQAAASPAGVAIHPIEELHVEPHDDGLEDLVVEQIAPWGDGAVAGAVTSLEADQLAIIELRYIDDASLADIAVVTGTTVSAVSQRLTTIHHKVAVALAA